MALNISRDILNEIVQKCNSAAPQEACGIIFGANDRVSACSETANIASDPRRHFEIDPAALIAALRAERQGGPGILGWWHSHPSGDVRPSFTDAETAAADGKLWLILAGEEVALWRATEAGGVHGRFDRVELIIG